MYTFLVAKSQGKDSAHDNKFKKVNDKVNKLHQFVYVSNMEWAKYLKRLTTKAQMRADLDEILTEAGSTV